MVISSIDLKNGHVVQLENGKKLVIERDDAESLTDEFNRFGEIAVIDLDAALGNFDEKGETKNSCILKKILRRGNVRVGGGIRTVEKARHLISLGAEKIIIGSAAWQKNEAGEISVNENFLRDLHTAIGKSRVIISIDALHGNIAIHGWTETIPVSLIDAAKKLESYCSEFLFTAVEKEGLLGGSDFELAKKLREAVKVRIVTAGGVSSLDEIARLEKIGCDVQLGMALYTKKISLAESFVACLNWEKVSLIPVIAQSESGEVLMLGYANREAFLKTFATNKLTFFSRTRNELWTKGETSGNFLRVKKLRVDCDRDTVLATVVPSGPTCHTGNFSCFANVADEPFSPEKLYNIIAERFQNPKPGSYTATLNDERVREKILEESDELCNEAETREEKIWEAADLFYFFTVLLNKEKISWRDVYNELDKRHKEK